MLRYKKSFDTAAVVCSSPSATFLSAREDRRLRGIVLTDFNRQKAIHAHMQLTNLLDLILKKLLIIWPRSTGPRISRILYKELINVAQLEIKDIQAVGYVPERAKSVYPS